MASNNTNSGYVNTEGKHGSDVSTLKLTSATSRLFSVVLHLQALEAADIPATGGHLAHALFLSLLEGVDPALAVRLHDEPGYRPFTVSALNGQLHPSRTREGYVQLQPGALYWLRFTLLQPEVWQGFMKRVMLTTSATELPTPRYGAAWFRILRALAIPDATGFDNEGANGVRPARLPVWVGWPGSCTWGELAARTGYQPANQTEVSSETASHRDNRRGVARINLRFYSPTAFSMPMRPPDATLVSDNLQPDSDEGVGWATRGGKRMELWPRPELVFGSLARTWSLYSPFPLPVGRDDLERLVAAEVIVSRYDLQTQMLQFPRHKQLGFVGNVTYECMAGSKLAPILETLADFALYAGVGYKTGMGMGQTRRVLSSKV